MLRRYTQQTLLDDLLPPQPSLVSQELEVESRRGVDPSALNLSLLRPSTVSESVEMELEPLSPDEYCLCLWMMDSSFESVGNSSSKLRPIEKQPVNRKRRRRPIPVDQCISDAEGES